MGRIGTGLSEMGVVYSRKKFGINRMERTGGSETEGYVLLSPFLKNVQLWVIGILLACCLASYFLIDPEDVNMRYRAVCNLVCVVLSYAVAYVVLRFISKHTQKKTRAQVNFDGEKVQVRRGDKSMTVTALDIVVDDIVLLEEGVIVPADGILLNASGLRVDESLIGGNNDVLKGVGLGPTTDASHIYPQDWVMGSSSVVEGTGVMKVTRVGVQTEYGRSRVATKRDEAVRVPFIMLISKVAQMVSLVSILYSVLLIIICLSIGSIKTIIDVLSVPTNILTALLPIGIPYVMSIALYVANNRLGRMGVRVKDMYTPFMLGMISSVITGRLGLITNGNMKVQRVKLGYSPKKEDWLLIDAEDSVGFIKEEDEYSVSREALEFFHKGIALSTTAFVGRESERSRPREYGSTEEITMLNWLSSCGVDIESLRKDAVVIDRMSSRRESGMCAALVQGDAINTIYIHGKPKEVASLCSMVQCGDKQIENDYTIYKSFEKSIENTPYNILTIAYAHVPAAIKKIDSVEQLRSYKFILLGFMCIEDTARSGIAQFVRNMWGVNIDVKIVSSLEKQMIDNMAAKSGLVDTESGVEQKGGAGSQSKTLGEILSENGGVVTYDSIKSVRAISQAPLSERLNIVRTMQNNGEFVAVVSSERRIDQLQEIADVSIVMRKTTSDNHSGTEISIYKDHLNVMERALRLGREMIRYEGRLYGLMMGVSATLVLLNTLGIVLAGSYIISVVQMFWLNIIDTAIMGIALLVLRGEKSLSSQSTGVYNKYVKSTDFVPYIIMVFVYDFIVVFLFWLLSAGMDIVQISDLWTKELVWAIPTDVASQFSVYERTLIMTIFTMCIFWNLISIKAFGSTKSLFRCFIDKTTFRFILISLFIPLSHFMVVVYGGNIVMTATMSLMDWVYVALGTSAIIIIVEIRQLIKRLRSRA